MINILEFYFIQSIKTTDHLWRDAERAPCIRGTRLKGRAILKSVVFRQLKGKKKLVDQKCNMGWSDVVSTKSNRDKVYEGKKRERERY